MSYISEIHLIANFWYPASLELDTTAISTKNSTKSPNNDVYDAYTILLESDCIISIQKTFNGEFKKNRDFVIKTMIFPKTDNLWLDENTLKTKNAMLPIF